MHNIADALQAATQAFSSFDNPKLEAEYLLAAILKKQRTFLRAFAEAPLTPEQVQQLEAAIRRRQQGEPLAYITGEKSFWNLNLKVNHDVLLPRPDTEILVDWILNHFSNDQEFSIADLGTGSGAIALALAQERPCWQVVATDYSAAALLVAKDNAKQNAIENIFFSQGSWCAALPHQKFDLIISNPPYIAVDDPELELNVSRFEPQSALIAKDNGLADIKKIIIEAKEYLTAGGYLILEHGCRQKEAVQQLFNEYDYKNVQTLQDLQGLDRVTLAQK